jgi:hypothetical protein
MRTNPASVPEKTEHDPFSLIFITQRFGQDKTILNSTAPGNGTSEKVDLQTTRAHPRLGRRGCKRGPVLLLAGKSNSLSIILYTSGAAQGAGPEDEHV